MKLLFFPIGGNGGCLENTKEKIKLEGLSGKSRELPLLSSKELDLELQVTNLCLCSRFLRLFYKTYDCPINMILVFDFKNVCFSSII